MGLLARHWSRIAITLVPLVFALLHATGVLPIGFLQRLDAIIYDARLRATMPRTLEQRVVIVDIDEKSLAEVGRWPWGRHRLAAMVDELFDRQKVAILGFDVVFAEPDDSSGLKQLREMAQRELKDVGGFQERLGQLQAGLDYDAVFARSLEKRPVVLGYYLTSDRDGRTSGVLPAPVMDRAALQGRPIAFTRWNGYGSNIEQLAKAAPVAGYFNSITDGDGVVRSIPLVAEHKGAYYESLSLAVFRTMVGQPAVEPGFPRDRFVGRSYSGLESIVLKQGQRQLAVPVDDRVATLVPFRGEGGAGGGSFQYVSAADVLAKRLPEGSLRDKIVLVGTTAPGLLDLRVTPVGETYPGVETHANVISGLLDGKLPVKPDYTIGYEVVILLAAGLLLAFLLPLLSATVAVLVSVGVMLVLVALNYYLFAAHELVMPLASALVMAGMAFALNMSYGYFVESRSKRELANLFGTYVPPELVDEMVKDPDSYSMKAASRELTVMFCDMRGFTKMSERMEPTQLQELLNAVFSRLTDIIRANRGTIDKYMGDCVMAFWGAPVDTPNHAELAVKSAMEMARAVHQINEEHRAKGLPEIGVGIGLNTGSMCVGDMGSDIRRSYTVIGDAVNLGSRLEGLSKVYGVDIVVSESARKQAPEFAWQELDRVRVKGKEQAVGIFYPVAPAGAAGKETIEELRTWGAFLKAYRAQDWDQCDLQLLNLQRMGAKKYLYELYSERVASMRLLPFDPGWDGATNFETK
ncbi:CHASE2 domain-containing protein [Ramlibacter pallidus]|uniref:Adenylate/guanylate cyclase domain-containing protein n=1 Tax=Ramlibacter pallidus TaxID=2780087 RepID=A0ABR9S1Q4_9BURK|nr:adenylate/guanylate cyclase domain-containing protein [Ramlibacter pallidus]MBE7367413.1 adenylate/guanylate cyclase domain-containing protein [Ramlibacter pallidus]